ncbi:MAG: hypothetical protein WC566_06475 [Dehalococcoidia bacterium]
MALVIVALLIAGCSQPAATTAPAASETPAVDASPRLGINSLAIDVQFMQGDSKTVIKKITFMNEGGGVMIWALRKTVPWIWTTEMDGALEKGYSKTLDVYIAPAGMEAGTYTENITIEGTGTRNSPQNVVVTMVITPPAATPAEAAAAARKETPLPPWDYNEYFNDVYNFRIRYPKEYKLQALPDSVFGAIASPSTSDANTIRVYIVSSFGVDSSSVAFEWAKSIRLSGGGASPKVVASDNATTLLDGVTPAFEYLYDAKSATKISSQVYVYGVKKGNRYILFGGVAPLDIAPDRLPLWKEIAHTMEFVVED